MKQSFASPLPRWLARMPVSAAAAMVYGMGVRHHNVRYDRRKKKIRRVNRPVISIGGIRAGGTGKTPTVMLLIDFLNRMSVTTAVLSRGYRRTGSAQCLVTPQEGPVDWHETGDEPAMIRAAFPNTYLGVGADRYRSAIALERHLDQQSVFLLDDGFQHRKLHRDIDIVCLHESVFTDRLLPQGYLREPVAALARADILFLISSPEQKNAMSATGRKLARMYPDLQQYHLVQNFAGFVHMQSGIVTDSLPFKNPGAFCGIARPERFFSFLASSGVVPVKKLAFSDHYRYRECDILSLRELYSQGLVTTEKDVVRLIGLPSVPEEKIWYLKMRLDFAENESFDHFNHYITSKLNTLFKAATRLKYRSR